MPRRDPELNHHHPAPARTRSLLSLWNEASRSRRFGPDPFRQADRLADMVAHARQRSPYLRQLYAGLPERPELAELPVTTRAQLQTHFDDWVCDPRITTSGIEAFLARPGLAGTPYLGQYLVATTSGTTGTPAVYIKDAFDLRVNQVLSAQAFLGSVSAAMLPRIIRQGGRTAFVSAVGGHHLAAAGVARIRSTRLGRAVVRQFDVQTPIVELVEQLNEYRPALLFAYGSMLTLLAGEQRARRLRITPALVEPAGETMTDDQLASVADAFRCPLSVRYGGSECAYATSPYENGWYHVNNDWVLLEPIDDQRRPTAAGQLSSSVLITNLANRVQPLLRYEISDQATQPATQPSGRNRLPAIKILGRRSEPAQFVNSAGHPIDLYPWLITTIVDHTPGILSYQVVQTGPTAIDIRLRVVPPDDRIRINRDLAAALTTMLTRRGLDNVAVTMTDAAPFRAATGKTPSFVQLETIRSAASAEPIAPIAARPATLQP